MKTSENPTAPVKLAVLISSGGTTLQNLIDRIASRRLHAEIVLVISSQEGVFGLQRAASAHLPHRTISRKQFGNRTAFGDAVFEQIRFVGAELVCLAGFLELLPIPPDFTNRVMNIHPALIPAFCGKGFYGHKVHEAALAMGVKLSGCTVHFADNQFDHGPIILQRAVPVLDTDTPVSLAARVFEAECEAFPAAIHLFAQRRLIVENHRVRVLQAATIRNTIST